MGSMSVTRPHLGVGDLQIHSHLMGKGSSCCSLDHGGLTLQHLYTVNSARQPPRSAAAAVTQALHSVPFPNQSTAEAAAINTNPARTTRLADSSGKSSANAGATLCCGPPVFCWSCCLLYAALQQQYRRYTKLDIIDHGEQEQVQLQGDLAHAHAETYASAS